MTKLLWCGRMLGIIQQSEQIGNEMRRQSDSISASTCSIGWPSHYLDKVGMCDYLLSPYNFKTRLFYAGHAVGPKESVHGGDMNQLTHHLLKRP